MPEPKRQAYLIRLWQEGDKKKAAWRFVLINLIQGQRWGFSSRERLMAFLEDQIDILTASDPESWDESEQDDG
jgi:hypothetical protein